MRLWAQLAPAHFPRPLRFRGIVSGRTRARIRAAGRM